MSPATKTLRRLGAAALLASAFAAPAALAQGWSEYVYPDAHAALQFPAMPGMSAGMLTTGAGTLPSTLYAVQQGDAQYSLTVADFAHHDGEPSDAIAQAQKAMQSRGTVKVNVEECISGQPGHEFSLAGNDGSLSKISLFAVGSRFYMLEAKLASPNDPRNEDASSDAIRFQQSLRFTGDGLPDLRVAPICRGRAKEASKVD